jgi:hypothetical protein
LAFGVKRHELRHWQEAVSRGEIAYLTHYWTDTRFPSVRTVTKVGCSDRKQKEILEKERLDEHIRRFRL